MSTRRRSNLNPAASAWWIQGDVGKRPRCSSTGASLCL